MSRLPSEANRSQFMTHELADGGLRHRWLRQDGFAITPRDWDGGYFPVIRYALPVISSDARAAFFCSAS